MTWGPGQKSEDLDERRIVVAGSETRSSRHTDAEEIDYFRSYVVAVAPGFGFGISRPGVGLNIQLAADVPVAGRVVDSTGAPVQGAQVRVRNVYWPRRAADPHGQQRPIPPGDGLDPWLAEVGQVPNLEKYKQSYEYRGSYQILTTLNTRKSDRIFASLIAPAISDQNGRFMLHGIGAERVAEIYIDGVAKKASSLIVVATRLLEKPITIDPIPNFGWNRWNASIDLSIYGANFETTLSPGRTIEGVVSDLITGSPIAGVKVIGPALTILESPGYDRFFTTTDKQGYFRIAGLPVRAEGTFHIEPHETLPYLGREMDLEIKRNEFSRTLYPSSRFNPYDRNTTVEVNIPEGVETFECEVRLYKGNSRLVEFVGPDGKSINELEARGLANQNEEKIDKVTGSQFQVTNLYPGEERHVVARHVGRKLIGMAVVTEKRNGLVTLRMEPWANVKGRLVDEEGNPHSQGLIFDLDGGKRPISTLNGRDYDFQGFTIDADGRFELQGLVPGTTYQLSWVESRLRTVDEPKPRRRRIAGDLVLKPGEVRDLGAVKVMKSKN
ncbi:MAG TPA: carboxypeptidase-like regulatory domain-containing protein [Planctomycetaceae bacterium]|jgi:hypothetical protein